MMFQIATATSFSIKKNTECSFPNYDQHIRYANSRWSIQANKNLMSNLNNAEEYEKFIHVKKNKQDRNLTIYEYPFHYTSKIPEEQDFIIDGYFQSEKYFLDNKKEVLEIFRPNEEIEDIIYKKYSNILTKNSVSLHVRRGDYIRYPTHHPVLSVDYYLTGLNIIKNYDNVIVFSDDIEWCKENFKFKNIFFIEREKDYIELFLMAKCKNNIIANSSFSWWGAWLNQNIDKIVIAPNVWFGPVYHHYNMQDLIPETWVKV